MPRPAWSKKSSEQQYSCVSQFWHSRLYHSLQSSGLSSIQVTNPSFSYLASLSTLRAHRAPMGLPQAEQCTFCGQRPFSSSADCFAPPAMGPGISLSNKTSIPLVQVYSRVHTKAKWSLEMALPLAYSSEKTLFSGDITHHSCLSKDILWRPHFVSVLPSALVLPLGQSCSLITEVTAGLCLEGSRPSWFFLIHKPTHP